MANRMEWELKGKEVLAGYVERWEKAERSATAQSDCESVVTLDEDL